MGMWKLWVTKGHNVSRSIDEYISSFFGEDCDEDCDENVRAPYQSRIWLCNRSGEYLVMVIHPHLCVKLKQSLIKALSF